MLVSGYSGIGKSSVVNELHKVAGAAARACSPRASSTSTSATSPMRRWRRRFKAWSGRCWARARPSWRPGATRLREALGPNGQLMVDLVPELRAHHRRPAAGLRNLPPQDAQRRFQLVFRRFLGVFARPEHPLALFLDDLQWLDAATLDLLEHLATQPELRHLLLVGAYRDNEVTPAHPLMRRLAAIRGAGARVQEIVLAPLGLEDVGRLIADALHCAPERAAPLARLVHEKTGGNPFFTIQFLTALAEEGLLAFDHGAGALVLGPRAHPRQGFHRQCGGPDGRQAAPPAGRRPRTPCSFWPASATVAAISDAGPGPRRERRRRWMQRCGRRCGPGWSCGWRGATGFSTTACRRRPMR